MGVGNQLTALKFFFWRSRPSPFHFSSFRFSCVLCKSMFPNRVFARMDTQSLVFTMISLTSIQPLCVSEWALVGSRVPALKFFIRRSRLSYLVFFHPFVFLVYLYMSASPGFVFARMNTRIVVFAVIGLTFIQLLFRTQSLFLFPSHSEGFIGYLFLQYLDMHVVARNDWKRYHECIADFHLDNTARNMLRRPLRKTRNTYR
ncbi:hypothetical protein BDN72DRAFT_129331 [Pluteus cervinus]|uniref:Uncharacterized protein n=1 Tax=Pluteus cervinus TaxID=181527 RepID=A0ACD3AM43_9AGAR|nr:hypothetical protein BDN72DRAFT_129331 [Pluteus cervinus]